MSPLATAPRRSRLNITRTRYVCMPNVCAVSGGQVHQPRKCRATCAAQRSGLPSAKSTGGFGITSAPQAVPNPSVDGPKPVPRPRRRGGCLITSSQAWRTPWDGVPPGCSAWVHCRWSRIRSTSRVRVEGDGHDGFDIESRGSACRCGEDGAMTDGTQRSAPGQGSRTDVQHAAPAGACNSEDASHTAMVGDLAPLREVAPAAEAGDGPLVDRVSQLIEQTRAVVAKQANVALTLMNWHIGRMIDVEVLRQERAGHDQELVASLGRQLRPHQRGVPHAHSAAPLAYPWARFPSRACRTRTLSRGWHTRGVRGHQSARDQQRPSRRAASILPSRIRPAPRGDIAPHLSENTASRQEHRGSHELADPHRAKAPPTDQSGEPEEVIDGGLRAELPSKAKPVVCGPR